MKALAAIGAEIAGLFVEDRAFALAVAVVVAVVGILAAMHDIPPATGGLVLFGGLAIELVASVVSAAKRA